MSSGGSSVWRECVERDPLAGPGTAGGRRDAQAPGRRPPFARIEAHAELILSAVAAESDITLAELQERLRQRGVAVAIGTLWRFFKRRKITRKKRRRTPPNSAAAR